MNIGWSEESWDEYLYRQEKDKNKFRKINSLIKDITRNGPSEEIGKPEILKHRKAYSRRIDEEHRLVYGIDENGGLLIYSCKGHYDE